MRRLLAIFGLWLCCAPLWAQCNYYSATGVSKICGTTWESITPVVIPQGNESALSYDVYYPTTAGVANNQRILLSIHPSAFLLCPSLLIMLRMLRLRLLFNSASMSM